MAQLPIDRLEGTNFDRQEAMYTGLHGLQKVLQGRGKRERTGGHAQDFGYSPLDQPLDFQSLILWDSSQLCG